MLKQLFAAVMGGIMIAIGGCVYLAALPLTLGSFVGAFFFSVALVCICYKGYGLFTGRVGYFPATPTLEEAKGLGMTLLGNAIATFLIGALIFATTKEMQSGMAAVAYALAIGKVATPWYLTLLRAVLCGVLMYLAVSIYREKNTVTGILFCVPAFIIAGFEHSIADMFYFAASGYRALDGLWFLLLVIVGNAIGGMLLPLLTKLGDLCQRIEDPKATETEEGEETEGEEAPVAEVAE